MTPSIYSIPNSARNMIFSGALILLGWFGLWMFWPSMPVSPQRNLSPRVVMYRYLPRPTGAVGVTWSSVLIGLPNKVGFINTAQKENPRLKDYLKPKPMSVEYASFFPGGGQEGTPRDDFMEWARSGRPESGKYTPTPIEQPLFEEDVMTTGDIYVEVYGDIKRQGGGLTTTPLLKDASTVAAGRWIYVTFHVTTGEKGRVNHVFIETPSGVSDVDQALLKSLYAMQTVTGKGDVSGTVRITIAGRHSR